ncbi:MAG: glycosyltransferase family 4 protein [Candidatus Diapherotrites archaeon]|nr:glycosyltransferase family 4 protein [Candidatus Diapherotrites archaeon]
MALPRILLVAQWFPEEKNGGIRFPGGTERAAFTFAKAFQQNGYPLQVLAAADSARTHSVDHLPVREFRQKSFFLRDYYSFRETRHAIDSFSPDVVLIVGCGYHFAAGAILAARLSGKKAYYYCALHSRESEKMPLLRLLDETVFSRVLNLCEKIFAPTPETGEALVSEMKIDSARLSLIPAPLHEFPAHPVHERPSERLLFVGRLEPRQKGILTLLDSMAIVHRRMPDTVLFLGGFADRPEILVQLRSRVLELGLQSVVRFEGYLDSVQLEAHLRSCTALVIPSNYESFGYVLVQALSFGVPVIASDIPSFRSLTENGSFALLFRKGDAADLAEKITFLLEDPALLRRLSESGPPRAQDFSVESVFPRLCAEMNLSSPLK